MADLRVLLCDDDPDLLGLLTRRVEKMGLEYEAAGDGRKAMALVDERPFDVIVTDIYMPEATGLEVLQHAKQKDPDVQVVIITSAATLDNAIDALNHGAFGYLTKPFDHLIVFDNMVSRAAEYRQLLIDNKHRAEAQRRRGDMLEDEVAERVQQIQKKQKGLLDLLGSLPDGILVVEEGGKVVLSSPVGERWLARDGKSEHQPIHGFISQVNAPSAERTAKVRVEEHDFQLIAVDFPSDGDMRRKAVIIREVESDGIGAGSLVTETVMGIKKGLANLYQQGVGTEAVLNLASQFAVLEQLAGWSPAKREVATESLLQSQPETRRVDAPIKNAVSTMPTPVEESEGPKLNTAELAEALRAAAQVATEPVQQAQPAAQVESAPEPLPELLTEPVSPAPADAAPKPVEPASLEPRPEPAASAQPTTVAEPTFPKAQPRELDPVARPVDTGLFRPRIIPEAMSAKLGEPPPIQPTNGKRGLLRIGSSAANTQIFRRVLEKMSGETVIGPGDAEPEPGAAAGEPRSRNGEPEPEFSAVADKPRSEARNMSPASAEELEPSPDPVSALRQLAIAAEPDLVAAAIPEPVALPKRKAKPKESEPRPAPTKRAAASWPPKLPSKDPDWDDSLEANE
jgi:DNA-binding response OmpR family regulator